MFMKRHTEGHDFIIDEVISALQKSIRRKLKEEAIYWALQLHNSGYGNAVFKRLTIILSEDIGVAESTLPICYANAYAAWKKIVGKKVTDCTKYPAARDILIKVVALFSDANKTRIVNNAAAYFSTVTNKNNVYDVVPNDNPALNKFVDNLFIKDKDNTELKQVFEQLIYSIELNQEEKALYWLTNIYERVPKKKEEKTSLDLKCQNKDGVLSYYWSILKYFAKHLKKEQKEIQNIMETLNTLMLIYEENTDLKLAMFHALLLVVRLHSNDAYLNDKFGSVVKLPILERAELDRLYKTSKDEKKEVPDYAVDKHTGRGKSMKRGLQHFFTEGAFVLDPPFADLYLQRAQEAYYKIEKEMGVKAAKSTQIRKRKRSAFDDDEKETEENGKENKSNNNTSDSSENSEEKNSSEEMDVAPPKKKRKLNNNNVDNMDIDEDIKEKNENKKKENKDALLAKQMNLKKLDVDPDAEDEKNCKELKFDGSIINDKTSIYDENEILYNGIYAQLPAGGKPTTFLATLKLPEFKAVEVFVKGPCLDPNYNIGQCMIDEAKKLFGLNSVGTHRILLKPDINYHRVANCNDFLLMRDVGEGSMNGYPTILNKGYVVLDKAKLNTPDLVQYFKNEKNNKLDVKADRELLQQYSRILAFRALFETSDANNHNFLIDITKNKLYSIDENVVFKGFMNGKMYSHFPVKSIGESVAKFCKDDKFFGEMLDEWKKIVEGDEITELLLKFKYDDKHVKKLKQNLTSLIAMHKENKLQFYRK